jgi:hypothetical protein
MDQSDHNTSLQVINSCDGRYHGQYQPDNTNLTNSNMSGTTRSEWAVPIKAARASCRLVGGSGQPKMLVRGGDIWHAPNPPSTRDLVMLSLIHGAVTWSAEPRPYPRLLSQTACLHVSQHSKHYSKIIIFRVEAPEPTDVQVAPGARLPAARPWCVATGRAQYRCSSLGRRSLSMARDVLDDIVSACRRRLIVRVAEQRVVETRRFFVRVTKTTPYVSSSFGNRAKIIIRFL